MRTVHRASVLVTLLSLSNVATADWSANLGFMSEYYFRGIYQESTSANAGIDFAKNGFFVGTWAADVGDGLEVDGYLGYGFSAGAVDLSIGYTHYHYTGDFDDTYREINFGAAASIFSFDVAVGKYDNFDGPTLDYTFYSVTAAKNGFHGKVGGFARDFSGEYVEAGYTTTVAEVDLGVTLIYSNEELVGESDEAIIFTVGKSFDL